MVFVLCYLLVVVCYLGFFMASLASRFFSRKAFHSFGDPVLVSLADLCILFLLIISCFISSITKKTIACCMFYTMNREPIRLPKIQYPVMVFDKHCYPLAHRLD